MVRRADPFQKEGSEATSTNIQFSIQARPGLGKNGPAILQQQKIKFDKLVKSLKFRHACEGRHPEIVENTGFPPSRK